MDEKKIRSEKLHFNVSSSIKDILGRDLITNDIVAIFELVKNSYDANATVVDIFIENTKNQIIIADNGHGMSYEDIRNKWLFLAYSEKVEQTSKVYAGSKGIGRLSADRLGESLILRSKKNKIISEIIIDWTVFQDNQKNEFSSVMVDYNQLSSDYYLDKVDSGTVLFIGNLRDKWTIDRINKIEKSLARLLNPMKSEDDNFEIHISYKDKENELSKMVVNPIREVLSEKTISMSTSIKDNQIKLSLVDSGRTIYSIRLENHTILENIDFAIYFMNERAKYNFTSLMKEHVKDYGNIFIYKNNFRVMPYGEPDFDIFNLNLRKSQGYNRYLAPRELLGWISIIDKSNHFKEVSSRDAGFINNEYTSVLEDTYMELVHRPLEDYVQVIKFGSLDINELMDSDNEFSINKLLNRFRKYKLIDVQTYELPKIAISMNERIELLDDESLTKQEKSIIQGNVKDVIKNIVSEVKQGIEERNKLAKENKKLKRELDIKTNIILKEKPERQSFLEHELRKVSNDIKAINEFIMMDLEEPYRSKVLPHLAKYLKLANKLTVIQELILRTSNVTLAKKQDININSYVMTYIKDVIHRENLEPKVVIDEDIEVIQYIDVYEFGILIDNLIVNAEDFGAKKFDIIVTKDDITFISDTPSIKVEPIERVFELGFTTKENGTGMGLYIVKQISDSFGWEAEVKNLSLDLVSFKFKFKGSL